MLIWSCAVHSSTGGVGEPGSGLTVYPPLKLLNGSTKSTVFVLSLRGSGHGTVMSTQLTSAGLAGRPRVRLVLSTAMDTEPS